MGKESSRGTNPMFHAEPMSEIWEILTEEQKKKVALMKMDLKIQWLEMKIDECQKKIDECQKMAELKKKAIENIKNVQEMIKQGKIEEVKIEERDSTLESLAKETEESIHAGTCSG